MKCSSCASPIPAKSNICRYCETVNDTDLRAIHRHTTTDPHEARICPNCDEGLHTVDLKVNGKFLIERCRSCLGMFFDTGELHALVDHSVEHVYEVDFTRLNTLLIEEGTLGAKEVRYVCCPVCNSHMNRESAGARSGVVMSKCPEHGIWLDAGELGRILKWVKAGGKLLHERREIEKKERAEREAKRAKRTAESQSVLLREVSPGARAGFGEAGLFVDLLSLIID